MIHRLAIITNPVIEPKIGDVRPTATTPATKVLQLFLTNFIIIAFIVGAVVFLAMLLWGAITYITAGGDKERAGGAAKRITNALIGITLLLSSYAIFKLIDIVLGINLLKLDIPVIK